MYRLSHAPEHCYRMCHSVWRSVHMSKKTHREQMFLTAATGGHTPASRIVKPKAEMSSAAGTMARAAGQREHDPVKKEAKPHRGRASLPSWHGLCDEFDATPLDLLLSLAWRSRCQHHRGRPETLLQTTIAHILSRTAV